METERALMQERVRIAREPHDVVAHHLSVIAVHTGLAKYVLDTDPLTAISGCATGHFQPGPSRRGGLRSGVGAPKREFAHTAVTALRNCRGSLDGTEMNGFRLSRNPSSS